MLRTITLLSLFAFVTMHAANNQLDCTYDRDSKSFTLINHFSSDTRLVGAKETQGSVGYRPPGVVAGGQSATFNIDLNKQAGNTEIQFHYITTTGDRHWGPHGWYNDYSKVASTVEILYIRGSLQISVFNQPTASNPGVPGSNVTNQNHYYFGV